MDKDHQHDRKVGSPRRSKPEEGQPDQASQSSSAIEASTGKVEGH